ncbi:hypothetical protein MMC30_005059 [Trapelia coarctata]|nr:hypothetical protein [Trapelia coarctata]
MAFRIQRGQRLQGHKANPDRKVILIKTAPSPRFENEVETLELRQGHNSIRQLLDVTDSPQSMVLEFLDKNLYNASCEQRLQRPDVKRAVKVALEELAVLNANGRVPTDQF